MDCLSSAPPYDTFLAKYLVPGRPCLFDIDLTARWPAHARWTRPSRRRLAKDREAPTREPSFDYLAHQYGDLMVPVVVERDGRDDRERVEKGFGDILDKWRARVEGGGQGHERLYVKDAHLELSRGDGAAFYTTPDIFQDDWLNAFYTSKKGDDFRFVYMGEQGTSTLLHRDVYASNSWSTNILGTKLWTLFPPSVAHCLRQNAAASPAAELIPDIRKLAEAPVPDPEVATRFPRWREAWDARIEVVQQDGETIFVPSGWHHQVQNLSPFVLSVNHNWANSSTFANLYAAQEAAVSAAEEAMADVKELLQSDRNPGRTGGEGGSGWEEEWVKCVSKVVRADVGWDWETLWGCALHSLAAYDEPPLDDGPTPATKVFPHAAPSLRPPASFVAAQLAPCIEAFASRPEYRLSASKNGELYETVDRVRQWVSARGSK